MRHPTTAGEPAGRAEPGETHVLLDLDGTISDSAVGIARSLQHAFVRCGYDPPTDDAVRAVIGPPFEVSFPTLGVVDGDIIKVIDAYRDRYEDIGLFENEVYDGVVDMLDRLAADGHVLSIATAKPQPTAVRILDHFGLADRFRVIAGAGVEVDSGRRTKAEVITYALAELGLDAAAPTGRTRADVVMVGDRDHDVDGATANGLACIGVSWGFGSTTELQDAGAAAIAEQPGRVAALVAATYRAGRQ